MALTSNCIQDLNQKVEEALACPCLDDLKEGPCGKSFVAAFSCFLKSQATEKVTWCESCTLGFQAFPGVCLQPVTWSDFSEISVVKVI